MADTQDIVERLRKALADDLHTPLPWIGAGPSYGQPLPMELTSVVAQTEPDSECNITICRDAVTPDVILICAAVNAAPVLLAELDRLRAALSQQAAPAPLPLTDEQIAALTIMLDHFGNDPRTACLRPLITATPAKEPAAPQPGAEGPR